VGSTTDTLSLAADSYGITACAVKLFEDDVEGLALAADSFGITACAVKLFENDAQEPLSDAEDAQLK
jgi:hypothetical protein